MKRVTFTWGLALLWVAACGGSEPPPANRPASDSALAPEWAPTPRPKAERTIDHWDTADEDKYIGWSCENVVTEGRFRCDVLLKAGLTPTNCVDSFGQMRASAQTDKQRHAFRLIIAGLPLADSCAMVEAGFRIAVMSIQTNSGGK